MDVLKLKGGADGSSLGNARRALARLRLFAFERGRSDGGLPASPVFLNLFLKWVDERALSAGRGSQGGTTVCSGVRSGLLFLERHLGVPVPVSSIVAEAAAPPGRKRPAARTGRPETRPPRSPPSPERALSGGGAVYHGNNGSKLGVRLGGQKEEGIDMPRGNDAAQG